MASQREGKSINSQDILEKERMHSISKIDTVPMVRKTLSYIQEIQLWHFRKGIEGAALVHSVGAVNEFPEARDYSSILHSCKALLKSWNGPTSCISLELSFLLECLWDQVRVDS